MAIAIYKDVAKTILLDEVEFFTGDGETVRFMATYPAVAVYVDDIRTTKYSVIDGLVEFDVAPVANSTIVVVPENALSMQLMSDAIGEVVESIYIDTDQDIYLLSDDVSTEDLGELTFSTDNVTFYSCIQVLTGTDVQIYVKAALGAALNEVKTFAKNRIVVVSSSTPIDTSGDITVNFTVGGGKYGGVEIHEVLI